MKSLDWAGLLRAGLRKTGLLPRDFWRLTPIELMLILGADPAVRPMARDRLASLMAVFPDEKGDHE